MRSHRNALLVQGLPGFFFVADRAPKLFDLFLMLFRELGSDGVHRPHRETKMPQRQQRLSTKDVRTRKVGVEGHRCLAVENGVCCVPRPLPLHIRRGSANQERSGGGLCPETGAVVEDGSVKVLLKHRRVALELPPLPLPGRARARSGEGGARAVLDERGAVGRRVARDVKAVGVVPVVRRHDLVSPAGELGAGRVARCLQARGSVEVGRRELKQGLRKHVFARSPG
mmetsp:Transcript_4466/g.10814  ORF Transcript_4466/g.10814 Transcript_4466/m.10814 type:complete len:227 (+) Transcript_4466:1144-1824(+)